MIMDLSKIPEKDYRKILRNYRHYVTLCVEENKIPMSIDAFTDKYYFFAKKNRYNTEDAEKKKFVIYEDADGSVSEPRPVKWSYNINDIITVNTYGNQYKCIDIKCTNDNIFYHFKQGIMKYTYDY